MVLAALGLATVGCGSSQAALTVGGDEVVTREELLDSVAERARATNIEIDPDTSSTVAVDDSMWDQEVVAARLTFLAQAAILERLLDDEGVEVTEADRDAASAQLAGAPEQAVATIEEITTLQANLSALRRAVAPIEEITDADIEAAFTPVELSCARHVLVETEAAADDVRDRIEDGEDLADLAIEQSLDASPEGDLGCAPFGTYVAEFDTAVWLAEPGDLVGPIETEFGFHVIEVYDRRPQALDEVRDQIAAQLQEQAQLVADSAFDDYLTEQLAQDFGVEIDERFGSWDVAAFAVVPPEGAFVPPEATVAPGLLAP